MYVDQLDILLSDFLFHNSGKLLVCNFILIYYTVNSMMFMFDRQEQTEKVYTSLKLKRHLHPEAN